MPYEPHLPHQPFSDRSLGDQIERQRIQDAGGTVLIQRVNGSLAVSRALGDFEYKNNANRRPDQQLVSPEPEITYFNRSSPAQVAFIVLACDGIWDVLSNEELGTYILGRMRVTDDLSEIANSVLDMCLYKVRSFDVPSELLLTNAVRSRAAKIT